MRKHPFVNQRKKCEMEKKKIKIPLNFGINLHENRHREIQSILSCFLVRMSMSELPIIDDWLQNTL